MKNINETKTPSTLSFANHFNDMQNAKKQSQFKQPAKLTIITLALAIAISTLVNTAFASACSISPQTFTDVPASHWAHPYVEDAYCQKLISGVGNNRFEPDKNVTNAEWFQMTYNLLRSHKPSVDIQPWYQHALDWNQVYRVSDSTTLGNSYINGEYPISVINSTISRYDMAQTVYNALKGARPQIANFPEVNTTGISSKIADYNTIPSKYKKAVEYCYKTGFITGVDARGTFSGSLPMTRGAAAVVLTRLSKAKAGAWVIPNISTGTNNNTNTGVNTGNNNNVTVTPTPTPQPNPQPVVKPEETPTNPTTVKDMIVTEKPRMFYYANNVNYMSTPISVNNRYIPNKLANGKDITTANIKAMLAEFKVLFPEGTIWGSPKTGGTIYTYVSSNPSPTGTGCNAWAGMVADAIFGKGAKWTKRTDFENIKVGDILDDIDNNGNHMHYSIVTDSYKEDGVHWIHTTDGNASRQSGGEITWLFQQNVRAILKEQPKSVYYTAY